jgi:hypothetical protein
MRLSQTLALLKPSEEKTAAATATKDGGDGGEKTASSPTEDRLKAALKEATAATLPSAPAGQEKQAADSPIADLTKIAGQVASAEQEALTKEAQLYGAAVFDGFMARAAQYEAAGIKVGATMPATPAQEKQASAHDDSFEKYAAENPDLVKEAAELGYERTMLQMEQIKQAAYVRGHDEATLTIYKVAHGNFVQGFEDASKLLESIGK